MLSQEWLLGSVQKRWAVVTVGYYCYDYYSTVAAAMYQGMLLLKIAICSRGGELIGHPQASFVTSTNTAQHRAPSVLLRQ